MMRTRYGFIVCLTLLALIGCAGIATAAPAGEQNGQADTIQPYNGAIGPGNSLYGLKLAFEDLDESFTFNQTEKLNKQISHADIRLAELKRELVENKTDTANIALEQYRLKINQTDIILDPVPVNGTNPAPEIDETGLMHAREMITKHQQVLEDLLMSHPNNTGLARAYNNSIQLEQKFEKKIENAKTIEQQTQQNRQTRPGLQENQTLQTPGAGRQPEGNITAPLDGIQLQDKNKFTGNTTQNKDRNEEGINQSPQNPNRLQVDNSTGVEQPGQNGQQINNGNNKNAPAGNQQINTDQTRNTRNNNDTPKPTETVSKNSNGKGNGNSQPAGR